MANKRPILRLKGSFETADTPPRNSRQLPAVIPYDGTEDDIANGRNPFFAWRHARNVASRQMARVMGVSFDMYRAFEGGDYLGLNDEHIDKFCHYLCISPEKLVAPHPLPTALRYKLVERVFFARSVRNREDAMLALRNHCDDAERELTLAHEDASRQSNCQLVVDFLNRLKHPAPQIPLSDADEYMQNLPPEDRLDALIADYREELADLKQKGASPKKDEDWLVFCDCALRLYGPGKASDIFKKIRASISVETKRKPMNLPWNVFCDVLRSDPELLGPRLWDEDGNAQFIRGRLMYAPQAMNQMLKSFDAIHTRHQYERNANAVAAQLELRLNALEAWGYSEYGMRVMAYWLDRLEISRALGDMRVVNKLPAVMPITESLTLFRLKGPKAP